MLLKAVCNTGMQIFYPNNSTLFSVDTEWLKSAVTGL
jgi:hypothetical protein